MFFSLVHRTIYCEKYDQIVFQSFRTFKIVCKKKKKCIPKKTDLVWHKSELIHFSLAVLGLHTHAAMPGLLMGSRDPNSGPGAYAALFTSKAISSSPELAS